MALGQGSMMSGLLLPAELAADVRLKVGPMAKPWCIIISRGFNGMGTTCQVNQRKSQHLIDTETTDNEI